MKYTGRLGKYMQYVGEEKQNSLKLGIVSVSLTYEEL